MLSSAREAASGASLKRQLHPRRQAEAGRHLRRLLRDRLLGFLHRLIDGLLALCHGRLQIELVVQVCVGVLLEGIRDALHLGISIVVCGTCFSRGEAGHVLCFINGG